MERSSLNTTRHSLLARCVVLTNESRKGFDFLLAQRLDRFGPVDGVELGIIGEMAAALGRQRALENLNVRLPPRRPRHYQTNLPSN